MPTLVIGVAGLSVQADLAQTSVILVFLLLLQLPNFFFQFFNGFIFFFDCAGLLLDLPVALLDLLISRPNDAL